MKTKGARNRKGVARLLTVHGYIEVFEPLHPLAKLNGYVKEHRKLLFDAFPELRQLLRQGFEVHHINGIKTDNRLTNLKVMPKSKHTSITWKGKKRGGWSEERRKAKSKAMKNNQNWRGNIYSNPELLQNAQKV